MTPSYHYITPHAWAVTPPHLLSPGPGSSSIWSHAGGRALPHVSNKCCHPSGDKRKLPLFRKGQGSSPPWLIYATGSLSLLELFALMTLNFIEIHRKHRSPMSQLKLCIVHLGSNYPSALFPVGNILKSDILTSDFFIMTEYTSTSDCICIFH